MAQVRILVIEDDPDVRDTVCVTLETIFPDAQITAAEDRKSFLVAAEHLREFSLIVVDLMLPDISGMEICQQVRHTEGGERIPILAMTGYDTKDMKNKILAAGATAYLPKPFEMEDFVATTKRLILPAG